MRWCRTWCPASPPRSSTTSSASTCCATAAVPATLGYRGYTKSCCTSINHVVCHGIPGDRTLKDGDIVNIDVTPILDGWHGDTSRMFLVGDVPHQGAPAGRRHLRMPDARARAGQARQPARRHRRGHPAPCRGSTATASSATSAATASAACSTTPPRWSTPAGPAPVPNCARHVLHGRADDQHRPADVKMLDDGWTAVTRDRSLSAQFEHSIGITEDGCEIFHEEPRRVSTNRPIIRLRSRSTN